MRLFLSCASAVPYEPVRPSAEMAEEMQQLRGIGFDEQVALLRRLSPEKKSRYADVLRNFDPALPYLHPNQRIEHIPKLLALEDPLTTSYISAEVQKLQHPVLIEDLARWRAPGAVIVWARLSVSDEDYHLNAPSFIAADMVLGLAVSLEEFPVEVRQWAAGVRRDTAAFLQRRRDEEARNPRQHSSDPPKLAHRSRELVQRWLKANERPMMEQRYGDLVPGEPLLAPSMYLPGILGETRLSTSGKEPSLETTHQDYADAAREARHAGPGEGDSQAGPWILAAIAACVVSGVVFWLRRRLGSATH